MICAKIGSLYRMKEEYCTSADSLFNSLFKDKIFILVDIKEEKPLVPEFDQYVLLYNNKRRYVFRDNFLEKFEEVI